MIQRFADGVGIEPRFQERLGGSAECRKPSRKLPGRHGGIGSVAQHAEMSIDRRHYMSDEPVEAVSEPALQLVDEITSSRPRKGTSPIGHCRPFRPDQRTILTDGLLGPTLLPSICSGL